MIIIKDKKTTESIIKERTNNYTKGGYKKNKRYRFIIKGEKVFVSTKMPFSNFIFLLLITPLLFIFLLLITPLLFIISVLGQGLPDTISDFKEQFPQFIKYPWKKQGWFYVKDSNIISTYFKE